MQFINVHQAKTHLSKLLDRVAAGEDIVIARNGKPVAKLSPVEAKLPLRQPGTMKGEIWISEDFDAPDEEFERLFYGDEPSNPQ